MKPSALFQLVGLFVSVSLDTLINFQTLWMSLTNVPKGVQWGLSFLITLISFGLQVIGLYVDPTTLASAFGTRWANTLIKFMAFPWALYKWSRTTIVHSQQRNYSTITTYRLVASYVLFLVLLEGLTYVESLLQSNEGGILILAVIPIYFLTMWGCIR
jgi:hypothetical protein